jgi:hypothetical protein
MAAVVASTWASPSRIWVCAAPPQAGGLKFQTDDEHQEYDAELGDVQRRVDALDEAEAGRPDDDAGGEIAQHRAQLEAAEHRNGDDGSSEEYGDLRQQAHIIFRIVESLALCIAKAFNFRSRTRACARTCTRWANSSGRCCAIRAAMRCFELVEGDRQAAIRRRDGEEGAGEDNLQVRTKNRSPAAATDLTRAFSIWFQAVNTAEKVHRVRRRRQYLNDSTQVQPGGIADCIARLQREGFSLEQTLELIASMSIEPVFTAHPTESTRRTILRKQQHIAQDLLDR